ncbi:hypothetical protein GWN63_00705 [Candidatus Bathyarchaeota archaeon]|nr:helix-turn-helix domain-containing protein [Candidatus Bathyarchaeota archaeon]NIU80757.1 hypothetical protein [Candidatus Bathyarchaeota archaeon]NIV67382.1 hypothetical protein [Candidatus Bathyarchaeota archaeon]NIW15926.1 hypothetical protein [Candidatus Bathyarchaeota archaeon]NIW34028.1 hypothetical protein [Candidatus Bathyarchaeota archaeon]
MVKWTPKEEEELLKLYQTGHTQKEMADTLNRSIASVNSKAATPQKAMKR